MSAQTGYGEWAGHYDATVAAELDRFSWMPSKAHPGTILKRRQTWPVAPVALVCGSHNMASVSSTAWMSRMKCCRLPNQKRVYRHLRCTDVVATDLPSSSYVLCTLILADEHLADLKPVYLEAERLLDSGGSFVLIGYHLFFLMNGTPTHYHRADGVAVTIQSYVRLFSEHYQAGNNVDLTLLEFQERVIDEDWLLTKPSGENTCIGPSVLRWSGSRANSARKLPWKPSPLAAPPTSVTAARASSDQPTPEVSRQGNSEPCSPPPAATLHPRAPARPSCSNQVA